MATMQDDMAICHQKNNSRCFLRVFLLCLLTHGSAMCKSIQVIINFICMRLVIYTEDDEKNTSIAATSKAARDITIIR